VVAEQLEISIPAYSKIETGVTDVNLSRLKQIADLYDMTVRELLNDAGEKDDPTELQNYKDEVQNLRFELYESQKKVIELYERKEVLA